MTMSAPFLPRSLERAQPTRSLGADTVISSALQGHHVGVIVSTARMCLAFHTLPRNQFATCHVGSHCSLAKIWKSVDESCYYQCCRSSVGDGCGKIQHRVVERRFQLRGWKCRLRHAMV